MKQWVYISLMLLSTVFLLSCKDDELENVNVEDRMPELTLKFTEAEISRTSLNSSEPLQHVENVTLYIYEMKASTVAEGTTENAEQFVQRIQGATLCATEILPWKNQSTSSGVSMSYKIQTQLEPGGEYVFLAVGTDAESEENYEFPTTMGATFGSAQARFKCEEGTTLSEQELREKMTKSEFFSGYQVAKLCSPDPGSKSILVPLKKDGAGNYSYDDTAGQTTVELTRAVAGVLLYMTDIPARWNKAGESSDGYRVTKVKLRLHRMPASSVSLCGQSAGTGGSTEAGTEEGPVLIESMDLSELQFPSGGDLYQIVGQKGEVQTLDNTLLYGAYLLPVASETGKATFTLELWGKACDAEGTIKTNAIEEDKLDDFECILENTASSDFAIERNHVYCIGQKPVADDTEGDAPVSLAGKEIVVDVQDWTPILNKIEFPYVDTNAKFNPDFDPGYIFNCINASFTLPIVCNSNSKWQLSVPDDCDWLYIQQTNKSWDKTYTQERSSDENAESNSMDLTLFMMDYAEYRASYDNVDIKNDIRTVDLELRTMGYDETTGKESIVKTTTLTIKQYNAISVTFGKNNQYKVGFSRLDVGDEFYKSSEEAEYDMKNQGKEYDGKWIGVAHTTGRKAYGWGYWGTPPYNITHSYNDYNSGKKVIQDHGDILEKYWNSDNVAISEAITISASDASSINDVLNNYKYAHIPDNYTYDFWYLPACNELLNFLSLMNKKKNFTSNLKKDGRYWTANPTPIDIHGNRRAFAYIYEDNITEDSYENKPRICGIQRGESDNDEYFDEEYSKVEVYIRSCKILN
ncbi:hypothetical protein [Phocaeicola barnesiae]|uniref:hypothetical protein n=1 Tax=Phocaeicola barnesiae TaxID=376804 RepID=UPI0025A4412B|nr:hypothetical protein [Phocaeicola barnesiae]MDM8310010.1 hypothetical protein [Phocaeicola barnesiae]